MKAINQKKITARFQFKNWIAPAWLDSDRNLFILAWFSLGNLSSNSYRTPCILFE